MIIVIILVVLVVGKAIQVGKEEKLKKLQKEFYEQELNKKKK